VDAKHLAVSGGALSGGPCYRGSLYSAGSHPGPFTARPGHWLIAQGELLGCVEREDAWALAALARRCEPIQGPPLGCDGLEPTLASIVAFGVSKQCCVSGSTEPCDRLLIEAIGDELTGRVVELENAGELAENRTLTSNRRDCPHGMLNLLTLGSLVCCLARLGIIEGSDELPALVMLTVGTDLAACFRPCLLGHEKTIV